MTAHEALQKVTQVGIIGAGQMGNGIAQVFAQIGVETLLFDASPEALTKGMSSIHDRLKKGVEKGKFTLDFAAETQGKLRAVSTLSELKQCDIVIEAIIEKFEVKEKLFKELDAICKPGAVLATNTSSISITKIAACTKRPESVVGMHFMNPVPVMKLVEIIRGLQTGDAAYELTKGLVLALDKTPVTARFDYPGFIVNRILVPMINEACFALMEGIATVEEIDTAMKLGTNQPMGPLELADFVGLDTCYYILQVLHEGLGDDKYRACPLLAKYVEAGWYGRKSGRGFYNYK